MNNATEPSKNNPIRNAINFKHWEHLHDETIFIYVGSNASPFQKNDYYNSHAMSSFLASQKDKNEFFDFSEKLENETLRKPIFLGTPDIRILEYKKFLNMNQKKIYFMQQGELEPDLIDKLVKSAADHNVKEAKLLFFKNDEVKILANFDTELSLIENKKSLPISYDPNSLLIESFNEKYITLVHSGKNYVLRKNSNAFGDIEFEWFTQKEFVDAHLDMNKVETVIFKNGKPNEIEVNPARLWLESPESRSAKLGITFYPKDCEFYRGKFNAYMGRGCEPIESIEDDIKIYLNHIYKVICSENKEHYQYVLNWMAHLVQRPQEKPEVAILLKAGQGTGKGSFVKPLEKIIGSHYLYAKDTEQIIGKYNGELQNKILVFADEFFAGDKKSTDKLKTLITEPRGSIENKHVNRISVPCFARVIMATNRDNVINIEKDERRYMYIEVSDLHKQDSKYFNELHKHIDEKYFAGKLLNFLEKIDITDYHPRNVPKTKALMEQKIDNLEPLDKWIYESLQNGGFFGKGWQYHIPKDEIENNAEQWLKENNKNVWGDLKSKVGKLLTKIGSTKTRKRVGDNRIHFQCFLSLEETRIIFSEYISSNIDWD